VAGKNEYTKKYPDEILRKLHDGVPAAVPAASALYATPNKVVNTTINFTY
jgi:hypothetical protein